MKGRWAVTVFALATSVVSCGPEDSRTVRRALEGGDIAYAHVSRITPDDASDGNQFGASMDVDDYVVAVGAPCRKPGGAVYMFNLSGTQRRVLEGESGWGLGKAVALSDGTLAALAADEGPGGVVHVYRTGDNGGLERVADLSAPDTVQGDKFGAAMDLEETTLIVGAPGRGDGGEVWVFEAETRERLNWRAVATLESDHVGFGRAIALEGDRLAIGARATETGAGGSIWIFERSGGDWSHTATLEAPMQSERDEFGATIAMDGRRIAAGGANSGTVWIYEVDGDTWQRAHTIGPPGDVERFGSAIALEGDRLVSGTFLADDRVWIYHRQGGTWTLDDSFGVLPDDPEPNYFGTHVAIVGESVVAAGPDPPIMNDRGVSGYLQGWVDVFEPNAAPTVKRMSASGPEDRLFALELGVSDPEGQSIASEVVRAPRHGEVTGEGVNLNFRGDTDYHGTDTVRLAFVDPYGGRTEADVDLTIVPVNDAPRGADASVQVRAGEPTRIPLEAFDPEGDPIAVLIAENASHGVVAGERSPLTYTSQPDYRGFDYVRFRLTDRNAKSIVYDLEIEVVADTSSEESPEDETLEPLHSAPRQAADGCSSVPGRSADGSMLLFVIGLCLVRRRNH